MALGGIEGGDGDVGGDEVVGEAGDGGLKASVWMAATMGEMRPTPAVGAA
jgi:hypothetical protein